MKNILKKISKIIPDKIYLKLKYYLVFHKKLNLANPKSFNEKLQWLKLNDRRNEYVKLVDKYEVKKYVSSVIGEEYVIPTLGIYSSFDEINFNELPSQFVIKCTHDSGGLVICRDKKMFNFDCAKNIINKSLSNNYYYYGREWPYKNVIPRIIVEKYMEDSNDGELRDYKFFCFNGKVRMMFIASNRHGDGETYFDFFDEQFRHLPFKQGHENAPILPHKPGNFNKMIELAEKLSNNIINVRVDFYEVDNKIYFGEMTFFHYSGLVKFSPEEWDVKIGDMVDLKNE